MKLGPLGLSLGLHLGCLAVAGIAGRHLWIPSEPRIPVLLAAPVLAPAPPEPRAPVPPPEPIPEPPEPLPFSDPLASRGDGQPPRGFGLASALPRQAPALPARIVTRSVPSPFQVPEGDDQGLLLLNRLVGLNREGGSGGTGNGKGLAGDLPPGPEILDLVLVIDITGSMNAAADSVKAATGILSEALTGCCGSPHLGVVTYDDAVKGRCPLGERVSLRSLSLETAGGGDEQEGLDKALGVAYDPRMGWRKEAEKVVLVIADIGPHDADRIRARELAYRASVRGIRTTVLDVGHGKDPELAALAKAGGGHRLSCGASVGADLVAEAFGPAYADRLGKEIRRRILARTAGLDTLPLEKAAQAIREDAEAERPHKAVEAFRKAWATLNSTSRKRVAAALVDAAADGSAEAHSTALAFLCAISPRFAVFNALEKDPPRLLRYLDLADAYDTDRICGIGDVCWGEGRERVTPREYLRRSAESPSSFIAFKSRQLLDTVARAEAPTHGPAGTGG